MKKEFELTNLGLMKCFLGNKVDQTEKGIFIYQKKYVKDILARFKMTKCKPANTPIATGTKQSKQDKGLAINPTLYKQLVGSLMYLTTTRPNIMFAISLISRFMESPKDSHWQVGKSILRYIAGTIEYGILYEASEENHLVGYTNSDFAGSIDD